MVALSKLSNIFCKHCPSVVAFAVLESSYVSLSACPGSASHELCRQRAEARLLQITREAEEKAAAAQAEYNLLLESCERHEADAAAVRQELQALQQAGRSIFSIFHCRCTKLTA